MTIIPYGKGNKQMNNKCNCNCKREAIAGKTTGKRICVDFGHGGSDPGAVGIMGVKEKDLVLEIGIMVFNILKEKGVNVVVTRLKDEFVPLKTRCDISNNSKADLFVSIHCNAFTNNNAKGLEVYHYPGSKEGQKISKLIIDNLVKEGLYTINRGIKTSSKFQVLKGTKAPAILIELGFITNYDDLELIQSNKDKFARSIAESLLFYLQ